LAARGARATVYIELDSRTVKPFRDYAHGVGVSFLTMLASPLTAPLFLAELFFGWLDFSTQWGTGFIVDPLGHIVTNAHVVGDEEEVTIARSDDTKGRARVIAVDADRDLALLRLKGDGKLSRDEVAPLGSSSGVRIGQEVVIFGFPKRPFTSEGTPRPTVTHGIVSTKGIASGEAADRIQLDAPANGGASGSPVLDEHGAVIAVVTEVGDPAAFENQTFAIPIDDVVKAFFKRAVAKGGEHGHPH
ncbi:MAG: S1C family serine protease, partial [Planctomycetota bacterium]